MKYMNTLLCEVMIRFTHWMIIKINIIPLL